MSRQVTIYSIKALARRLGYTYRQMRAVVLKYRQGKIESYEGYKFFGVWNKCWFAYPADASIEIVLDEGESD